MKYYKKFIFANYKQHYNFSMLDFASQVILNISKSHIPASRISAQPYS